MSTLYQTLHQYFGFQQFRDGQEEPVRRALAGQHTLLVMPTGAGKSLAYQLPALLLDGLTLVISPLIALMQDQVHQLTERGLPATFINSSLPGQEINRRLRAVREGHVKLLYIAPERLRSRHFTGILAQQRIAMLAVDEAHCLSQWGHDFRPDYLHIGPIWQAMGRPTLLATTATATPQVRQDIIKLLDADTAKIKSIVTGFNRPNLTFRVKHTPNAQTKLQTLQAALPQQAGSAIIYCATRRNSDDVADFVRHTLKIPAAAYHAGLDKDTRYRIQTDFMADRLRVVAATNAFGMGVDKPDVRLVLHYNLPASVEAYYQEAGRAGRDGDPADCLLLFGPDDQRLQHRLITGDTPSLDDLHQLYTRLAQAARDGEAIFAAHELAETTGQHPIQVRVALSELEQAGLLYHLGDDGGYGRWKVQPLDNQILRQRAQAIERRARIRLDLLNQMLTYAQLSTCRRQFLLGYFGDAAPPKSPRCCDNHGGSSLDELPKATTPEEWFPLIVLETTRTLAERPVGRKRLAQLLNGSQAKGIAEFGYDQHKFYGKLGMLSQPQITALVDDLLAGGYLRLSGGEMPVLLLTDTGAQALTARAALPIAAPGYAPPAAAAVEQWQQSSHRSDTVQETLALFEQGLSLPEIAEKRDLKESTIYTHLSRLIADGKVELHQVVTPEIEAQVLAAVAQVGSAFRMSPLKQILRDAVRYGQIRCVIAAHPELPRDDAAAAPPVIASEAKQSPASGPAAPPRTPAPQPATEAPPDTILAAVEKLGGTLGRTGLAQFLTGSKAAWLETFRDHSAYGQLSDFSQRAVVDIIDALITDGKLATTGGIRPKVITPAQKLPAAPANRVEEQAPLRPRSASEAAALLSNQEPTATILATVADLDGLLSPASLAALLTAGPDDVVSFSDHPAFGAFHGQLTADDLAPLAQQLVQEGKLLVNAHRRLELTE